jgi:NADH dehydrogenase
MGKVLWKALTIAGSGLALAAFASTRRSRASHRSQSEADYERAGTRILILGGGFGGATTALELDRRLGCRRDVSVLVVDRSNAQLFVPLLWTVAAGRAAPTHVTVPLRSLQRARAFHLLNANVESVDLEKRVVRTSAGERGYDTLVIALGSVTAIPGAPGVREHVLTFRSPADAVELRNHLIDAVEHAHRATDPAERAMWSTFVIVGGGDTGSELAAAVRDYLRGALWDLYPWLLDTPARVVVIEQADRLVPLSPPRVSALLRARLEAEGIEVRTGTSVERVTDEAVYAGESSIPTRTVFWSAGVSAPEVVRNLPVHHERNGALVVDRCLRLADYPNVYAIGDNAWAKDETTRAAVPALAQAAEYEAKYVAASIASSLSGRSLRPFRFNKLGQMILLGRRDGIVEIGPLTVTGFPAWLMWHGYYLSHIGSWRNRVLLAADWFLSLLVGRETSELALERKP